MGLTREVRQQRKDHALIGLLRALANELANEPLSGRSALVLPVTLRAAADRLEALTGGPPAPIGAKWKEGRGR